MHCQPVDEPVASTHGISYLYQTAGMLVCWSHRSQGITNLGDELERTQACSVVKDL